MSMTVKQCVPSYSKPLFKLLFKKIKCELTNDTKYISK